MNNKMKARKSWVKALFDLGATPLAIQNGTASHADVAEAVRRVEVTHQRTKKVRP